LAVFVARKAIVGSPRVREKLFDDGLDPSREETFSTAYFSRKAAFRVIDRRLFPYRLLAAAEPARSRRIDGTGEESRTDRNHGKTGLSTARGVH
jgi:hypothetical protein